VAFKVLGWVILAIIFVLFSLRPIPISLKSEVINGIVMMKVENERMFKTMEEQLYSSVISDIMDGLSLREQVMREYVRPLYPEAIVAGRAVTALAVDVYKAGEPPYDMEIELVDSLREGDVVVLCTNGSKRGALWGELLSTASRARGARGAIIDGFTRDVKGIVEMKFPVFASGVRPLDSRGRTEIIDYNCPVECGGVLVNPGDIVFGDIDGVVIIPKDKAQETIERALEKIGKENLTRTELEKGALLRDVYKKYGTL